MYKNNNCPYSQKLWVTNDDPDKGSIEYSEKSFPRNKCIAQQTWCDFNDFKECLLYQKKQKE